MKDMAQWQELSAAGIYKLDLTSPTLKITCYPWYHNNISVNENLCLSTSNSVSLYNYVELNKQPPQSNDLLPLLEDAPLKVANQLLTDDCKEFLRLLTDSVLRRVESNTYHCNFCTKDKSCGVSHIAIMFSGGIDSMMLAHVIDKCLPETQSVDLLNVAFENSTNGKYDVPDRKTGLAAIEELNPKRAWNFVEVLVAIRYV